MLYFHDLGVAVMWIGMSLNDDWYKRETCESLFSTSAKCSDESMWPVWHTLTYGDYMNLFVYLIVFWKTLLCIGV